jgi:hypothetical protein
MWKLKRKIAEMRTPLCRAELDETEWTGHEFVIRFWIENGEQLRDNFYHTLEEATPIWDYIKATFDHCFERVE